MVSDAKAPAVSSLDDISTRLALKKNSTIWGLGEYVERKKNPNAKYSILISKKNLPHLFSKNLVMFVWIM